MTDAAVRRSFVFALAAWLVPLIAVLLAGLATLVPQPSLDWSRCRELDEAELESESPLRPGEVFIGARVACHEAALDPTLGERARELLGSETAQGLTLVLGLLAGIICASIAIRRTRSSRQHDAAARRTFRIAVAALVVLFVVPLLLGAGFTLLLAVAPIHG